MKIIIIIFSTFLFTSYNYKQVNKAFMVKSGDQTKVHCCNYYYDSLLQSKVYTEVTVLPEFPGGKSAFYKFIREEIKINAKDFVESDGRVVVEFIITKEGKLFNPKVLNKYKENYSSLDTKMVDVFNSMPVWTPGNCNDSIVSTLQIIPIVF